MRLDKSRILTMFDSSRKFIPKQDRCSVNDAFVARNRDCRMKKGKNVSRDIAENRCQKLSGEKDKRETLEVEIHRSPVHNKDREKLSNE